MHQLIPAAFMLPLPRSSIGSIQGHVPGGAEEAFTIDAMIDATMLFLASNVQRQLCVSFYYCSAVDGPVQGHIPGGAAEAAGAGRQTAAKQGAVTQSSARRLQGKG